ncbi:MAG: sulfotransferase family protein [Nostoc sp.]|uniref:sulfotransferase family protein n=1 Tax=Nostoc sp. TaxID=1180 RepID=UPI002FF5CFF8
MNKIFGIGLSRTGTTSLHYALMLLGYSSVHMPMDLAEIDGHDASSDTGVSYRFEELDQLYQGSKFILTVRNLEEWLQSCEFHFNHRITPEKLPFKHAKFLTEVRTKLYGTVSYEPVMLREAYQRHMQRVENYFAHRPQDLLVLNICTGDSWNKLCPFLGRPIPDTPFPHVNRTFETKLSKST